MTTESDVRLPKADRTKTSLEFPVRLHDALLAFADHLNEEGERTTRTELIHAAVLAIVNMDVDEAGDALREYRRTKVSSLPILATNVIDFRRRLGRPRGA